MAKPVILLYLEKRNWYSFVPLVNSLEHSGIDAELVITRDLPRDIARWQSGGRKVIACLSFFSTQARSTSDLVAKIRSRHGREVILVAGGPHATGASTDTLGMGFDYVVKGEGELVLPDIIRSEMNARRSPKTRGQIVEGVPLPDLDTYPPVSFKHHLYPPIEITRGCLFCCRYCSVPLAFRILRHRSVESIRATGERLVQMGKRWDFRFISPNSLGYGSTGPRPHEESVEELLSTLVDLKGRKRIFFATFPSEGRPDFVTDRMVEIISEMADNRRISIGAQTGSEDMMRRIGRGHGVEVVYRATEIILSHGLIPVVDFILGLPGEREQDQQETLEAMRRISNMGGEARIHHFIPLPGSAMGGEAPAQISPSLVAEIGRMSLNGLASGSFTQQMKLAREVIEWQDLSSSEGTHGR